MPARTHVIVGRCRIVYADDTRREQRGDVVVHCKPDDTLLVHDADGYQPVAWLTRADRLAIEDDRVVAWSGDARLEVTVEERYGGGRYPVGIAGDPVGDCPDCTGTLVRASGEVTCLDCDADFGLPSDADLLDDCCPDCDLPRMSVTRGERFEVCLDPGCEPLDEAVTEAFDRKWDCPDCGEALRVIRRGGLLLACDGYPDCEWNATLPRSPIVGECECGLPLVEDGEATACLDDACDRATATPGTP
jgi:DNA topoisomerase-1